MTIVLTTSSTASVQRMCVSPDTPDLRGRAGVNRAQDLELRACGACVCHQTHLISEVEPMTIVLKTSNTASVRRMCVSPDTPDLRGRADVNRAQDLELRACSACVCHKTHLFER